MTSSSAIAPPLPSKADGDSPTIGRSLLDLLRSRDKLVRSTEGDNSAEIDHIETELLQRLHTLDVTIRRRGLFNNDSERAQTFYNCASERSSQSSSVDGNADDNGKGAKSSSGNNNKRKRKGGGASSSNNNSNSGAGSGGGLSATSYGIFLDSHSNAPFSSISGGGDKSSLDEGLILTVVCRILGVTVGRRKKNDSQMQTDDDDEKEKTQLKHSEGLMKVALSIISSICDHAKDGIVESLSINSQCALIEGDMIGSIGSSLLDALRDNILSLYYQRDSESITVMVKTFRAAASVITLLEMRLSRSEKVINGLRDAAWLVLNNLHSLSEEATSLQAVQQAVAVLLASLPLSGSSDGSPPAKTWAKCIQNGVLLLRWAINDFFPMPTMDNSGMKEEATKYQLLWKEHERWMSIVTDFTVEELDLSSDPTDSYRARALQLHIECLSTYITSLIKMEGYPLHRANAFSSSALLLPFDSLLDVSELLLSFPLAAEGKHRSTKQRLRSTPVEGGLISPDSAISISVELRLCGHALFNVAMEACRGGSGALSRGRRIVGMATANLQSSCSMALVSVVNGKRSNDRGRRIGWLRGSIPLRIKSIQMFLNVAISLGCSAMSSVDTAKSMSKALVLVGGCLLEQVTKEDDNVDEWGTIGERAKLVEISATALASCIASFGGLIPINVRSTIDSILHSCLTTLYCSGVSSIFAYSETKRSILQLATNCITVPWGDGGRSTVQATVRKVSLLLKNDSNLAVASMALSTLSVVDAFSTPRAPAILIASRKQENSGDLTASEIIRSINEKEMEIKTKSKTKGTKEKKKISKKEEKVAAKAAEKRKASTNEPKIVEKKSKISGATEIASTDPLASNEVEASKSVSADSEKKIIPSESSPVETSKLDITSDSMEVEESADTTLTADTISQQGQEDPTNEAEEEEEEDNDSFSLDDFPEIVDEEPDEEDRM